MHRTLVALVPTPIFAARPGLAGLVCVGLCMLVGLVVAVPTARAVVVPTGQTSTEGNSQNAFPFSCGAVPGVTSQRYQQVYQASEVGTDTITQILLRQDAVFGTSFGPTTILGVTITLSSTTAGPDGLSSTFASNVGADVTTVFSGDLTLSSGSSGASPRPFDITIPLTTPFFFDASAGLNLLLDVTVPTCAVTTPFDAQNTSGDSVGRAFTNASGSGSATADVVSTLGLVSEFLSGPVATPTPTPTPTATGGGGIPTATPSETETPAPCDGATVLPPAGGVFPGDTTGGQSALENSCVASSPAPERVFAWTPAASGVAIIHTCGSTIDTNLYMYAGSCPGSIVACDEDFGCGGGGAGVSLYVSAGTTYYIVVDSYGGVSGAFTLTVIPPVETPISGKKILIKDNPGDPSKRKVVFLSKDPGIDTSLASGFNPAVGNTALQVYNPTTGESACFQLEGIDWTATGTPPNPTYKLKDSLYAHGPCKVAVVKHGKLLKVVCLAKAQAIPYSLNEATQGSLAVRFLSNQLTYCSVFGGTIKKDSGTDPPNAGGKGLFLAKDAPAPVSCPPPPVACF